MSNRYENIDIFATDKCLANPAVIDKISANPCNLTPEQIEDAVLYNADCFEILSRLPANSVIAAMVDGPYGIGRSGKEWDTFSPSVIKQKNSRYVPGLDHRLQTARSDALFAGSYDLSRTGAIKYQKGCQKWASEVMRILVPGGHLFSFCSPRLYHRMACGVEDAGFEIRDQFQWVFGSNLPKSLSVGVAIDRFLGVRSTAIEHPGYLGRENWDSKTVRLILPSSKEGKLWDGWGTGLKQTNEPILLARKPLATATIAENVLRFHAGALNIARCRIRNASGGVTGRYPSNTILSDEIAGSLGDKGDFFKMIYCPKPSQKEKEAGCEHLPAITQTSDTRSRTYKDRCGVCGKRFMVSPNSRCSCPKGVKKTDKSKYKKRNYHPTVKPVALLEYLLELVVPPDGNATVLDIFMGAGTTGMACADMGLNYIGIEIDKGYFEIAKARIRHAVKNSKGSCNNT